MLAAWNIALSRTPRRRTGASGGTTCRRGRGTGSGTHRAAAHGTPSLTRHGASRMHGATFTGTQGRTRAGCWRSRRCWCSTLLRAWTLEQRLPANRLASGAGYRRRRRMQRLRGRVINRPRTGLGHNHAAASHTLLTKLSRSSGRRPGRMASLGPVGRCRRWTIRLRRTRRSCRLGGCSRACRRSWLSAGRRTRRWLHRGRRNRLERRWRYRLHGQYPLRLNFNRCGSNWHGCLGKQRRGRFEFNYGGIDFFLPGLFRGADWRSRNLWRLDFRGWRSKHRAGSGRRGNETRFGHRRLRRWRSRPGRLGRFDGVCGRSSRPGNDCPRWNCRGFPRFRWTHGS